jgi:hypothetical protein
VAQAEHCIGDTLLHVPFFYTIPLRNEQFAPVSQKEQQMVAEQYSKMQHENNGVCLIGRMIHMIHQSASSRK